MDGLHILLVLGCLCCIEGTYPCYSYFGGENIMLNKTSTQNYAWKGNFDGYGPQFGNDGEVTNMIGTGLSGGSFWQVDLQGYYTVRTITLTSTYAGWVWNDHLRNAYIGVSVLDTTSPGSDVIICGQWPNQTLTSATLSFSCNLSHPVRFVKVWKGVSGHLGFSEVTATGQKTGIDFVLMEAMKVNTTINSLTVDLAAECASNCFYTEQCIAFSFRQGGQLNCLLAADVSTFSDSGWVSYSIKNS